MCRYIKLSAILFILASVYSCSNIPSENWRYAVPEKTPFIIIPSEHTTVKSVLKAPYIPLLEDITSSAIQLISQIDTTAPGSLPVNAILLYPGPDNKLQPIWITTAPDHFMEQLRQKYYERFTQNHYYFHGTTIYKLQIQDRKMFACQMHDMLLLSESSLALEDAVRAYLGLHKAASLTDDQVVPGSLVMNTPSLNHWIEQLAKIMYRPSIKNAFTGSESALLHIKTIGSGRNMTEEFSGDIPTDTTDKSELIAALSQKNTPITLDRYISSNAAAFGIFRLNPRMAPPSSLTDTTRLDSILMNDKKLYSSIARQLDAEFAIVMYAESGFLSTGEHIFIRKMKSTAQLENQLSQLADKGLIKRVDDTYLVNSRVIAQITGSELCNFREFYLTLTGDAVVISKRKGLAKIVASDRDRRRVIYYEQNYMDIREQFPKKVSGIFIANKDFNSFIEPFLGPDNYITALTSKFDFLSVFTQLKQDGNLAFNLKTFKSGKSSQPYQEQWVFPTGGADLTGKPVLADIGGSSRDEVVFSTKSGSVNALATDGTVVVQVNTGDDVPIGPPVVYDWYGTNQNVILQAAGNKIYGWNDTGSPLPKFPFNLGEKITTPLTVDDIDRDGLPDAVVATANRKLHALNGRGNDLPGWPVITNTIVRTKPLIDYFNGEYSIMAFSENTVHAWSPKGVPLSGFPKFVNASLYGSPVVYNEHILGGAADGNLYAIGNQPFFSDSLNIYNNSSDSSGIEAVYVSNSALTGSPSIQDLTIKAEGTTYSDPMILTMSSNGSVFLLSKEGQLRFTQSMGQPSASDFSPFISDIDSNGKKDVIALANFGRLYAWQVENGERIYSIPTAGIKHCIVTDIDLNGYKELIAQTNEGVRCWTIFGQ